MKRKEDTKFKPVKPNFEAPLDKDAAKRAMSLKKAGFGKKVVELIKKEREKGYSL